MCIVREISRHVVDIGITCVFVPKLLDMLYINKECSLLQNMFCYIGENFMFCMTCCMHTQVTAGYQIAFIYIHRCILVGKFICVHYYIHSDIFTGVNMNFCEKYCIYLSDNIIDGRFICMTYMLRYIYKCEHKFS